MTDIDNNEKPVFEIFRGNVQALLPPQIPARVKIECPCGDVRTVTVDERRFESITRCPTFPICPREITVRLLLSSETRMWELHWKESAPKTCAMEMVRIRRLERDDWE